VAFGTAAALLAAGIDVLYLVIIASQRDRETIAASLLEGRVVFVATFVALCAAASWIGARREGGGAEPLAAAAGGLLALGLLAIFSIGVLLLAAGGLCLAAWVGRARTRGRLASAWAFLLGPAVLGVGTALTS
jgi:hypothetical protein